MSIDLNALQAPFSPDRVSWRVGSTTKDKARGMALAYLDARDVMERLDSVCGAAGWQCRYPHAGQKTVCEIGIKVGEEWIWKADGAGDSDIEAEKGALSDAFKRAAVKWGIGRYLYDMESPWVELEARGNSYSIKPGEYTRLTALLAGKAAPASPAPRAAPADHNGSARDRLITRINACNTAEQLDATKALPDFVSTFKRLDADDQSLVRRAGEARRAALTGQPVLMAG